MFNSYVFLVYRYIFDRDWKKIEAFVGSKTAIQIRSHAQKYFLKVQKSGTSEHLPPPRPKRKAAHPYPQNAPKVVVSQSILSFQASPTVPETGIVRRSGSSSLPRQPHTSASLPRRTDKYAQTTSLSHVARGDVRSAGQPQHNVYSCVGNECTPKTRSTGEITKESFELHFVASSYSHEGAHIPTWIVHVWHEYPMSYGSGGVFETF